MVRVEFIGVYSRRIAHHTDDLLQRWLLSKEVDPSSVPRPRPPGKAKTDLGPFTNQLTTESQAREQIKLIQTKLRSTDEMLGGMDDHKEEGARSRLIARRKDLVLCLRATKQFLDMWSNLATTSTLEQLVRDNDPELRELSRELLEYRKRDKSGPRPEQAVFDRKNVITRQIQDELMRRKLEGDK